MLEESGDMEGTGNISASFPSCDFLLDLPELQEKTFLQHGETTVGTSGQANCDPQIPVGGEAERIYSSEDETSEVVGGYEFDVADLDAILGYTAENDDEAGTYHVPVVDESPVELTSKRKRLCMELENEEEVVSKFSKRQMLELDGTCHGRNSPDASSNISAVTQPPCDDTNYEDEFCLDQSTEELQMLCDDFAFEMLEHQCSSRTPDEAEDCISSGSARQSRRQKIKATVKLLREAIPGGECMDTAIVLDEAINYVKLLQLQVQGLGAQRLAQRAAVGR
jgi:hypothetical protein